MGGVFLVVSLLLHGSEPSAGSVVWVLGCASVFLQEWPALSFLYYFLFIDSQFIFQSGCMLGLVCPLSALRERLRPFRNAVIFVCVFSGPASATHQWTGRGTGATGSGTCCCRSRVLPREAQKLWKWWPLLLGFTAPTGSHTGPREITQQFPNQSVHTD